MFRVRGLGGSGYGYYLEKGLTDRVYWEGRSAELMGVSGEELSAAKFNRALQGIHPETGEVLKPRKTHDKFDENGEALCRGKTVYDCVLSAPKSLSVMGVVDPRLDAAHKAGVRYVAEVMEGWAMCRVRKDGADTNRMTRNLLMSQWPHETSRMLDPNKHTHLPVMNLTYDPVEGQWKALQAASFFKRANELTEVYRYVTAHETEKLGYKITGRENSPVGWEIAGVGEAVLEKYSQRSRQRDDAIEGFIGHHGRGPTDREISILVRNHRPAKEVVLSQEAWREDQLNRLLPSEFRALMTVRDRALEHSYSVDMRERTGGFRALSSAKILGAGGSGENRLTPYYDVNMQQGKTVDLVPVSTSDTRQEKHIDPEVLRAAKSFAFHDHEQAGEGAKWKPWRYGENNAKQSMGGL